MHGHRRRLEWAYDVVMEQFDAADWLGHVEGWAATHATHVPVGYPRIVEHPEFARHDVRSLRSPMSCGSPLHAPLKRRLMEAFGSEIVEPYGLTGGIITTLDPEDAAETPRALVVLREGRRVDAEALRARANERLGRQQRLGGLEFRAALPRNANGKLLKRELRAPYGAHRTL